MISESRIRALATILQKQRRISRADALWTVVSWTDEQRKRAVGEMMHGKAISSQLPGPRRVSLTPEAAIKRATRLVRRKYRRCQECIQGIAVNGSRCRLCALRRV